MYNFSNTEKKGEIIMKTANIAIFENNDDFLKELTACFSDDGEFNVVAAGNSGTAAIEQIKNNCPDVIVLNLVLSGTDGFGVLDYIRDSRASCVAIVVSNFADDKIVNSAISHGAAYYLVKPVPAKNVLSRVKDILSDKNTDYKVSSDVRDKRRVSSLDEKISNIFITIGIPPHIKGFSYLREGIKMAVEEPSIINRVTKELYPRIGEKFSTSASKVERAIRHAIEVAWNRGRTDAISAIFGARVYIGSERPTNSEFIALVADKLLLELI